MKKGFTLLELLAVIVVLAIIALIATPFVTKAIENARKGAFKSSAYGIINAAEIYYASNMIKEEVTSKLFTITNGKFVSGEEELIFEGKAPTQGTVMIRNDGKISLNVSDGVYRAEKTIEQQEVNISLATAPSSDELALQLEDLRAEMQSLNASLGSRVTAVETKNADQDTTINTNNTDSNIFLKSYPVGSLYTTSIPVNPRTTYGGTWVLAEKNLKNRAFSETHESTTSVFTPSANVSDYSLIAAMDDHTYNMRIYFKTTVPITDSAIKLGTIDYSQLGITRLYYNMGNIVAVSDGANGTL